MFKYLIYIFLFLIPYFGIGQLTEAYLQMKSDDLPGFEVYEKVMLDATQLILDHPEKKGAQEYRSAMLIIEFWKDEDTGVNIPIFGSFYQTLVPKTNQQYLYMISMIKYVLDQKLNHKRHLKCVKIEGEKFSQQSDVREVQLEGAKIFLEFTKNKHSGIRLGKQSKKYLKAYKNSILDKIFFT